MEENATFVRRQPKRQLVYPFHELQYQEDDWRRDTAKRAPTPGGDRLIPAQAKLPDLDDPAE